MTCESDKKVSRVRVGSRGGEAASSSACVRRVVSPTPHRSDTTRSRAHRGIALSFESYVKHKYLCYASSSTGRQPKLRLLAA